MIAEPENPRVKPSAFASCRVSASLPHAGDARMSASHEMAVLQLADLKVYSTPLTVMLTGPSRKTPATCNGSTAATSSSASAVGAARPTGVLLCAVGILRTGEHGSLLCVVGGEGFLVLVVVLVLQ